MLFSITPPEALATAASDVVGAGFGMTAPDAAATDAVSRLAATQFDAHAAVHQAMSAPALTIHEPLTALWPVSDSPSAATQLTQFTEPNQSTTPSGLTAQSAAVTQATATQAGTQQTTLSQLMSALPTTLQGMASPSSSSSSAQGTSGVVNLLLTGSGSGSSSLDNFWNEWGPNATIWNSVFASGFYAPSNTIGPFMSFMSGQAAASAAGNSLGDAAATGLGGAVARPLGGVSGLGSVGNAISADLASAARLGPLSVPPTWTAAAPLHSPLASTMGGTPMVALPSALAAGTPPLPLGGTASHVAGRAIPRYGFRPTFVTRPPAAG